MDGNENFSFELCWRGFRSVLFWRILRAIEKQDTSNCVNRTPSEDCKSTIFDGRTLRLLCEGELNATASHMTELSVLARKSEDHTQPACRFFAHHSILDYSVATHEPTCAPAHSTRHVSTGSHFVRLSANRPVSLLASSTITESRESCELLGFVSLIAPHQPREFYGKPH